MKTHPLPLISICVCTFQRPLELARLLRSLRCLDPSTPVREIIVVDNDAAESAEPVVQQAIAEGQEIQYLVEPVQSIALARTKSVRNARGDWLAFIDDDEIPDSRWLSELWRYVQAANVDAAFGVVEHCFEASTPQWIRVSYPTQQRITGATLRWWDTATNNALVRRSAVLMLGELFDPAFGLTGGEDSDLFRRMWEGGSVFIGVNSAIVRENVPASRAKFRYLMKWWLCAGAVGAKIHQRGARNKQMVRSPATRVLSAIGLGLAGGFCSFISRARAMRYLLAAAFESGFVYGHLTGRLPLRYPRKNVTSSESSKKD